MSKLYNTQADFASTFNEFLINLLNLFFLLIDGLTLLIL